jgi:hypothetical protein
LTSALSASSASAWPVMVSRSTNCTIMKIVRTNISTSKSPVIASTKPGQIEPDIRWTDRGRAPSPIP